MFQLPENFVTTTLGYSKEFFSDLKLPILLLFAVAVGLWIFSAIIRPFIGGGKRGRNEEEEEEEDF